MSLLAQSSEWRGRLADVGGETQWVVGWYRLRYLPCPYKRPVRRPDKGLYVAYDRVERVCAFRETPDW